MKTLIKSISVTLITLVAACFLHFEALAVGAPAVTDEAGKLEGGAVLKNITIPDGQPYAYVKVKTVIDEPTGVVWQALKNIERWPAWLPMSKTARILSPEAATKITPEIAKVQDQVLAIERAHPRTGAPQESGHYTRTVYELYDLPWPIKNEWVVRTYTYDESPQQDRATWRKIDSTEQDNDGSWEITPDGDNKTLLTYTYRVKAKESVPKPVFKAAVSLTVNSMIKALRHETARIARTSTSATPQAAQ